MKELKAVCLEITNVLGINEITIDLSGNVTEISGRNGEGKTSCIAALQSVLTSADSGTLLRNGATHGKAVLIMDDGSQIISLLKPGKSSKRVMFGADKKALGKSSTRIAELFNAHSLNPIDFLNAKGKARVNLLLEAMPIELDFDQLNRLCGPRVDIGGLDGKGGLDGQEPLFQIATARKSLYDLRTGDNRVANDTKATISTLQQSLDSAQPFDADRLTECNATIAKLDGELKDSLKEVKQKHIVTRNACESAINKAVELKQTYERACVELDNEIKAHKKSEENSLKIVKQQIRGFEEQSALTKSSTNIEIKLLETAKKAFEGQEVTRKSIKEMQEKVEIYVDSAGELTGCMEGIDEYKAELLANMPIKGLSIDGDKMMLDDVLFDRVNMAERVKTAMKLSELAAGDLKLILADGLIDILDTEVREEFYRQANASPCQFVVTRVSDEKLTVTQPTGGQGQITSDMEAENDDLKSW